MATKVDIIVPTYGQEDYTIRCFDTLMEHTNDYRLIWVDNGSSSDSRKYVMDAFMKHQCRLPVWASKNFGFVQGVNLGLEMSTKICNVDADYVCILNNDTELTNGWMNKMISVMERNSSVGAVGPISSAVSSLQGWEFIFDRVGIPFDISLHDIETDERAVVLDREFGDQFVEAPMGIKCPMVAFFCTVFRTEVFEKIGFLDVAYGMGYGDDDDFCHRMYQKDYRVALALGSYVFHNHRTTFTANYESENTRSLRRKNRALYDKKFAHFKTIERGEL